MEGKKISFGFMKTKKVEKLPLQEKKDYIECVEEKSIKVVGGEEVKEITPLVIPMKPNTLITIERLKQIAEKVEGALVEPETEPPPKPQETAPENETLDQMAVRELLEDSKKEVKAGTPQLTLLLPAKSVAGGEKESTLDDYESVPVQEFGLAMLRGMGWTKTNEKSTFKPPQLRPKGLGLGADKVVKDKQKATKNSKDEELTIVKNAFVKITTGKYNGYYGKVLSLDEDNGRVMVAITVKKETVSLSEFMMHPVTKSEFDKESKVINANSYEQYKKNEGQKSLKNSEKESSRNTRDDKPKHEREVERRTDNNNSRTESEKKSLDNDRGERNRDRSNRDKHRDSSEENSKKNKRDSSQESLSDSERKHKEKQSRKQYSSMESLNSDTERDNKGKEKRYDSDSKRDRSKKYGEERNRHDSDSETERRTDKETKKQGYNEQKRDDARRRNDSDVESDRKSKRSDKERRRHSSESDTDRKIKKKERRKHDSDSESDHRKSKRSDTPDGKRDIDKKRKGKKKKRDRDRSPNYRKHRK